MVFAPSLVAQSKILNGTLTNEKDVEGIHILNLTSRYNTVTNENGNFSIRVSLLDTLVFSSVNYIPEKVIISEEIYEKSILTIVLKDLVNELDPVVLGPNLSGNITTDVQNIKTEKDLNFDDVGIPGFKGKPEEKIVPLVYAAMPTSVNLEALYNHISGYYRKLRLKRKWEDQNNTAARIITEYAPSFFNEAYGIPENRCYDFILFCMETSGIQWDYKNGNSAGVLEILKLSSIEYLARLDEKRE
jgi:hypothetical protein